MSYCLSIHTDDGLILCTSSCASSSHITSSHMHRFIWPDNRFITILSSGHQHTVEAVLSAIRKDLNQQAGTNLLNTCSLDETADYVATISSQAQNNLIQKKYKPIDCEATFIVAGQIFNQKMETLLIYTQGNYIHEPNTSPFLQIGERKYGKPILDRMAKRHTDLATAARCALVSVDSTIRGNPDACLPVELLIYKNNSLKMSHYLKLDENNPFFENISTVWSNGITTAIDHLPKFDWEIQINK
jgi:putative proteasome-type protease